MPLLVLAGVTAVGFAQSRPEFDLRRSALDAVVAEGRRTGKPILNVGCPGGNYWLTYNDAIFDTCVDPDLTKLQFCHAKNPTFGDIRQLPFRTSEFGAALCSHVLEHLDSITDVRRAVNELQRTSDRVWILVPGHHLFAVLSWDHKLWVEWRPGGYQVIDRRTGEQQFVGVRDPQPMTPGFIDGAAA